MPRSKLCQLGMDHKRFRFRGTEQDQPSATTISQRLMQGCERNIGTQGDHLVAVSERCQGEQQQLYLAGFPWKTSSQQSGAGGLMELVVIAQIGAKKALLRLGCCRLEASLP